MSLIEQGYSRGWKRFGFDTLDFAPDRIHGGGVDVDIALAIDRGVGRPFVAYVVVPPGTNHAPPLGMHIHRSAELGKDVEEWYIIIEGAGVQRFTNGDSVDFGPGDLIAVYPGTGHSLEVTGDQPVKMIGILPEVYVTVNPDAPSWPETWNPRVRVLAWSETLNPTTAECSDCGQVWERPEADSGSNTLAPWADDHGCTRAGAGVHLKAGERD